MDIVERLRERHKDIDPWPSMFDEAAAEIKRLREALKPFADEAERMRNYPDDYPYSIPTTPITVGDLRRASVALAKEAGQ